MSPSQSAMDIKIPIDIELLSKRRLLALMTEQEQQHQVDMRSLMIELFCADPVHPLFSKMNEVELAPMRRHRITRLSGGGM